jgi:2Fe-2S ferredoxin
MPSITFEPNGPTVDCEEGETIFAVAQRHKVDVDTSCVGKGTCGLCRVRIVEGTENLNPYGETDEKHLGNVYHLTKVRLACQAQIAGDVTVEVVLKKRRKK